MTPNVPLIAWQPDADPTVPGVIAEVSNLLPTVRGYAPDGAEAQSTYYPMTMPTTNGSYSEGAACLYFPGGQIYVFVGAGGKLYMLDNQPFQPNPQDVSRLSSAYTLGIAGWQFVQFKDLALAVNGANILQAMDSPYVRFADVAGAPTASTVAVNRNFVVLGCLNPFYSPTWPYEDGWWCSAQEDHTNWTPDIATQCARGRLTATSGAIVRLIAYRDSVIAFKANSMYRGDYTGPTANTWSFPLLSRSVGLAGRNAVCEAENRLYWLGADGFYTYDGAGINRIASAPWNYINALCGPFFFNSEVFARWDRVRRCVRFYMTNQRDSRPLGLAYHVDTDRWGLFTTNAACAFELRREFVRSPNSPTPDNFVFPLGVIDRSDLKIKVVGGGVPGLSSFTSGDVGDDDQVTAMMRGRARFLSAPTASSMTHTHRMDLDSALTTGATANRSNGKYDVSHAARWHRMKFTQTGMYEVTGFSVGPQPSGKR
jgi:hypothetical protein